MTDGWQAPTPASGHPTGLQSQLAAVFVLLRRHGAGTSRLLGARQSGHGEFMSLPFKLRSDCLDIAAAMTKVAGSERWDCMLISQKLLRYIDDFLLITPTLDIAQRFVRRMKEGFPEYGAFVSAGKTLLSFECLAAGKMEEICVQGDCTCAKLFLISSEEAALMP